MDETVLLHYQRNSMLAKLVDQNTELKIRRMGMTLLGETWNQKMK